MRLRSLALLFCAGALLASSAEPPSTRANPTTLWVLNQNVVDASSASASCSVAHHCDLTSVADRSALFSSFDALQTQGGGLVQREPTGFTGAPERGSVYIVVLNDGSGTGMALNGRGMVCSPICDAVTNQSPTPSDHMAVWKIGDTGGHQIGDQIAATATQDSVSLDSMTITVVGPPGDTDDDGCPDAKEVALVPATDPSNGWDFYSVPVPPLFISPSPTTDARDAVVAASDAQAVFAYFKKSAKTGTTEYEQDLDGNGVKDGRQYDRTVVGPGQSGPPDGIIGASDAQLAFAQFKLTYTCK